MHASAFDRYQAGNSLIHRLDPRVKVVVTVLFILSNVLVPDGAWPAFVLAFALVLLVTRLARLPWMFAVKRSFIVLPFVLAAFTILFTLPGTPIFSFSIGSWTLTISDAGLLRFSSIIVRSLLSLQMAVLLTATTQFTDLIHALRHLRLPSILVAVIAFMYRYLFVLNDEVLRLLRARDARSARPAASGGAVAGASGGGRPRVHGGSVWWRARVAGSMAGQLFLRSWERSDRVYNAMLARGYAGHLYTLNAHVMDREDWLLFASAMLILLLVQIVGRLA